MLEKIGGNNHVNQVQPLKPEPIHPVRTPQSATASEQRTTLASATRRADVQQYGEVQRNKLNAAYAAMAAGAVAAQRPFVADARAQQAYQKTYGESLQKFTRFFDDHAQPLAKQLASAPGESGKVERYYAKAVEQLKSNPDFATTPKSMLDVATDASKAYRSELRRAGFSPLDVARPNPHRALDFMQNYAKNPNAPMTRLSPEALQTRIANSTSPGDYFVRITGEPYMHSPDAVLSPSPRAWMTTAEEAAGFKLNAGEMFAANGLSSNTPVDLQRMIVTNAADRRAVPATWESMIATAKSETTKPNSGFEAFAKKDAGFWNQVKALDYQKALDARGSASADKFIRQLESQQKGLGDVFLARQAMDNKLGVNKWFRGDGLVTYPDGTPSAREFGVGETPMRLADRAGNGKFPEMAVANLDAKGAGADFTAPKAQAVDTTPSVPHASNTLRSETKYGAIAGGATSAAISTFQAFDDVRNGRKSVGDAALEVGKQTAIGTSVGAGSAVVENYATRGVSLLAGGTARSALGQIARQSAGAGLAGAIVNTGFSLYDNHQAYKNGEISGAQYAGRVTAEAAVGAAAGVTGAAAGAYIGGVIGTAIPIPIVGTLAGAAVGAAVGMGADYVIRKTGADKMIAKGVTAAIEGGQRLAGQAKEVGAHAMVAGARVARQAGTAVVNGARAVVNQQIQTARRVVNSVSQGARAAHAYVAQKAQAVQTRISQGTRAAVQYVANAGQRVGQTVTRAVNNVTNTARQAVNQASNYVSNAVNNTVNRAQQAASNLVGSATSSLKSVFGW